MAKCDPIVAIIGRPNVGKSTLFNRIAQKRRSIVHPQAGITRDRVYETVTWTGRQFTLIDTGGYVPDSQDTMESAIRAQVQLAIEEADLILFMVDAYDLLMPMDNQIAELLRTSSKPILLIANKCDDEKREQHRYEFFGLGFGDVIPISAQDGRRIGDLLDLILENLPNEAPAEKEGPDHLRLAIVGIPNAGKSSIVNAILGVDKLIVTDIPGTTRDSIDSEVKYHGQSITLIDTAGLRKKRRIKDNIEFYSNIRTDRAIDRSNVAVVVIDAVKGFNRQDATIVRSIIDRKKGMVIAINKWDLIEKDSNTLKNYQINITEMFSELSHYPMIFISALTKQRIGQILDTANDVYVSGKQRITTNVLNKYFQHIIDYTPPPAVQGKYIQIKYVTQVKKEPPVFVFFCNDPKGIKEEYRRFLENRLRKQFGFKGFPVTLLFRQK
ncbi:MAG: ribosome biogenesis GTPase Der [Candidatus Marinimicrobia bacterium]|nr:ribosome biogenesis GTPase Der [Candidatus Neomarinimicrobiota bacterium]MBL7066287.1 ribosome biogenesis GTPase Der [Candidatus Neomarinimicrobiota bacterium]